MAHSTRNPLEIESDFLAGVEANLDRAKGRQLRGNIWETSSHDEEGALRALLAQHRRHDRALLKQLPTNRRFALHGYERRWWFGKRRTGVAIASVLSPLDQMAAGDVDALKPIDLTTLRQHANRLAGDSKLPTLVGVCAPSGFTEEARSAKLQMAHVTVVLVEPRADGGWDVSGGGDKLPPSVLSLFDPEDAGKKISRVRREIADSGADLLIGGVSAESIAKRIGLPAGLVSRVMEMTAEADDELRITRQSGDVVMYRGSPAKVREKSSMNVVDRIRAMFAREGDEAQKINLLAERRAALAQRRDRIYEDIGRLEQREGELLLQGRASESNVARRRMASQLAQLRKDIGRQNTTANMLNNQINIISTDIHNLTLIEQGEMARLPTSEELTHNAVAAEEMLETLKSDADLVSGLETGIGEVMTSDEELAILKEFEEPASRAGEQTSDRVAASEAPSAHMRQALEDFDRPASAPNADAFDRDKPSRQEKSRRAVDPEAT